MMRRADSSFMPPGRGLPRRLVMALGISTAVHLSAVTIFNVVIYFPISEIKYYEFRFVEAPRGSMGDTGNVALSAPSQWEWLPKLQPPQLSPLSPGRLALGNSTLSGESLADDIYGSDEEPLTSLGAAIENVQRSVRQLTLEVDRNGLDALPAPNVQTITPASGFTCTLTSTQRDEPRQLLFSPPLQSLWSVPPEQLRGGLNYTLSVDGSGRVTRVWNEDLRTSPELAALEAQLMQYRFAPDESGRLLEEPIAVKLTESDAAL